MKRLVTMCLLFVFLALPALAQLTGKINVVSVPDRYKISNKGQSTTGLTAVGVGQRIVVSGIVFGGAGGAKTADTLVAITNVLWTISTKPLGSAAALADTGAASGIMYFIPDSIGTYVITMNANTSLGSAKVATITINAAKFVGASIAAPSTNGVPNKCGTCHQGTLAQPFKDLLNTNHAQAVKRKLNETGGHFGTSCMSCHSIGYDGVTSSKNDGWDDLAAAADSTYKKWFPPTRPNGPGTFEGLVADNPNLMARSGIQCENCHGAASEHIKTGDKTKLDETLSSNVCMPCHYSSDRHGIGYQWQASAHAKSTYEGTIPQYTDRFTCAKCHTSQGYINETINGKTQPAATVTGGVVYENPMPVGCTTCHDPHTNNNPGQKDPVTGAFSYPQLRVKTVGEACIGCHITRISTRGLHSAHQGSMLIGANATHFDLNKLNAYKANANIMETNVGLWSGWELPGYTYENSSHSNIEERCVACHMAKSPTYIANEKSGFSIGDSMMTKLGRHTFNVASTDANGVTTLNPTGCMECHGTVAMDFVEKTQEKTDEMLKALYLALPKRDSTINLASGNTSGSPIVPTDTITWQNSSKTPASAKRALTTLEKAAAYNYFFVKNDLSGGVHNFMYAKGLLESSLEQVKLGMGSAAISQIKDVPMDNGTTVQIVWNKFPAESYSYGRLTSYSVWRRDPILPSLSKAINPIKSFTQMLSIATVGGQYTMGASVWTFVGTVPVSGQSMYSYIAPTLFDSTKTGGQRYSAFFIAGNTSDGTNTVYSSPIDSGYSVNNLLPSMVAGVAGSSSSNGVLLSWTRSTNPVDNDIAQYVVYRGTTAGFTPNPASPYATVKSPEYLDGVVTLGTTYYYRIGAVDKAGNAGPYSDQFSLKVTSVEHLSGLPASFAMDQNYPNPFNPSTQIKFALPSQANVSLNIYSVSGELVRTLVNSEMPAGFYAVTWNGLNDLGQSVSTGVYLFRVQAGTFVSSKKMLLVK